MAKIFHLLYKSSVATYVNDKVIQEILESSRRNNAHAGITGLLIYRLGHFLQLLEGDADAVRIIYSRIMADNRHTKTHILLEFEDDKRLFPQWKMGHIKDEAATSQLSEALSRALEKPSASVESKRETVIAALQAFSRSHKS